MKLGVMVASGVAMVAFATGAATSQTQAEMVTGVWNCSSQTPGGLVAGQMTYKADGTTQSVLTLTADIDGGKLEAQLDATSTWQLLGGGLIREQITSITARSAKLDGEDLPESVLTEIAENGNQEPSNSTIELSASQMVLVDGEGTRTVCGR
jgi:hypothetical protein